MESLPVVRTRLSLDAELEARRGVRETGSTAKRDLARYYGLLRDELTALECTREEIGVVCEAIGKTALDEQSYHYLWAEVDSALSADGSLAKRWGVGDATAFVTRIRRMHPAQVMALLDAAERCLVLVRSGTDVGAALRRLGFESSRLASGGADRAVPPSPGLDATPTAAANGHDAPVAATGETAATDTP